jgi:hypothetical protein
MEKGHIVELLGWVWDDKDEHTGTHTTDTVARLSHLQVQLQRAATSIADLLAVDVRVQRAPLDGDAWKDPRLLQREQLTGAFEAKALMQRVQPVLLHVEHTAHSTAHHVRYAMRPHNNTQEDCR